MNRRLRRQRTAFLAYLGTCFVALMAALPIVSAQTQPPPPLKKEAGEQKQRSAAAGASAEHPDFDQADRNKDGVVDKSEAGVVPGLSANFERADRSRDGKLDRDEFARGLEILQVRR
jgi:hypothetical protein